MREWLVLHGGALGDLALTLQLALRLGAPACRVVSRVSLGGLHDADPPISHLAPESVRLHTLFAPHDDVSPSLADLVSDVTVLNALGDADGDVHRRLLALQPQRLLSVDPRPCDGDQRHVLDQWCAQLGAAPACTDQPPTVRVSDALRKRGAALLAEAIGDDRPAVVIHPGSGGRRKCWPVADLGDVADRLRDTGRAVCTCIGPVELETWPDADLAKLATGGPVIVSAPPLRDLPRGDWLHAGEDAATLPAILSAAACLVSADSGPAHLAALLGTPTVTLFGPTSSAVWRPCGPRAVALQGNPAAGPSWGLTPDQVIAELSRVSR